MTAGLDYDAVVRELEVEGSKQRHGATVEVPI